MKKMFIVALICFAHIATAQTGTGFGVKAGLNMSNFTGDDVESDGATGFYVGALVDLPITESFHIQPEVLYSMEGGDESSLSFLRIPIMAKYYVTSGLNIQAGPSIGFKVAAEDDFTDEITKSTDIGLGFGLAYELPIGFFIDLRYTLGLSNIGDEEGLLDWGGTGDEEIKTTNFQIGVGYKF